MTEIVLVPKKRRRQNSPARIEMLADRYARQRASNGTLRMVGVPAWQNRRTGQPHDHARQKARRLGA